MTPRKLKDPCGGGGAFPDNFDGEFTYCGVCGRKLNLDPAGLVPLHNRTAAKGFVNKTVLRNATL